MTPSLTQLPISAQQIKLVVFDLDGTLYELKPMQKQMRNRLLKHLLFHPLAWKEIWAVYHFRRERKKRTGSHTPNLAQAQYVWVSEKTGIPVETVQQHIEKWMIHEPLGIISALSYKKVIPLVELLKKQQIQTAIFSDLEAVKKAEALQIGITDVFSAVDEAIDALKPHPAGLFHIANFYGVNLSEILFIGDKEELDGRCAREAGCSFVHIDPHQAEAQYQELINFFS